VAIGAELGKKNYGSISRNYILEGLEPLDARTHPEFWTTRGPFSEELEDEKKKKTRSFILTS
jgi:hypothetical protein